MENIDETNLLLFVGGIRERYGGLILVRKGFQLFQFFILDNQNYSSLLEVEGALVQSSLTEKDCTRVDNNLSVISVVRTKESVRNIRTKESVRNILKWILLSL